MLCQTRETRAEVPFSLLNQTRDAAVLPNVVQSCECPSVHIEPDKRNHSSGRVTRIIAPQVRADVSALLVVHTWLSTQDHWRHVTSGSTAGEWFVSHHCPWKLCVHLTSGAPGSAHKSVEDSQRCFSLQASSTSSSPPILESRFGSLETA
jgi:hypothetical protein